MILRSPGPVAGQTIVVKLKCRISFSEPIQGLVRGSLVFFKTKWLPYKFNFHVSFCVIVAMLQHRLFQNIKTDQNEFKIFHEKECNILKHFKNETLDLMPISSRSQIIPVIDIEMDKSDQLASIRYKNQKRIFSLL